MNRLVGKGSIQVYQGDLTQAEVDAIVNAANSSLRGGGGVDGAIHRAGGPAILAECRKLGGCDTGDAKATTGGNLAASRVIHTVGPIYSDGRHDEPRFLASCHRRSLEIARDEGLRRVAFPAISCGVYGYPLRDAAPIAINTVAGFLRENAIPAEVHFVLFSEDVLAVFEAALSDLEQ